MFNVIILSSGLSTRLRPITNQIPKCLVNVGQETALKRQVDYWIQYEDCNKIYVVIHPKYKDIVDHSKHLFWWGRKAKRCFLKSKEIML